MVAPLQISVISNERAHTHKDSLTIRPSNRRLVFLGRSLCRGTRKSRGRAQSLCGGVELRNVLQLRPRHARNLPYSSNQTPPFFSVYSNLRPAAAAERDARGGRRSPLIFADFSVRKTERSTSLSCPVCVISVPVGALT